MNQSVDWLYRKKGNACGTYWEARVAARSAISAALSILLDVPSEYEGDEVEILQTLILARWAVRLHQRQRIVARMTRYMASRRPASHSYQ
jgi:hypothetical protein